MACEQRLRAAQGTQLLPNVVSTEQQSLIVVKKLLAIAVSSITYLRGLFPEKAYGRKYVEEQKVMILREERTCPGASQIVQWMHGCFDALQRKYLRTVVMSIYTDPENPKKVTECYQFKVQYTEKGPKIDFERYSFVNVNCDDRASGRQRHLEERPPLNPMLHDFNHDPWLGGSLRQDLNELPQVRCGSSHAITFRRDE
ncbi:unnamed protein product [Oncorhynchus mykiss]|uniref:HORMA domain-containing protein n=1 Tax=Oncorhynchus mykiss TaxID=8022 RepID=A0A060X6M0_ONCMY|nr:unnamed protein product [Oncorhynchus mykiss]